MKLICYGSLMDQRSMEQTLGRPAIPKFIKIQGYQRVFNAPFGGYAYLNLAALEPASVEAVYYNVNRSEIAAFARREEGSELVELINGYWAFIWPKSACRNLPAVQSYIDMCAAAASKLGIEFWKGTRRPRSILDDRSRPLYEYFLEQS